MANSNTIQIEIQFDDKGGVKVLRQIGTESEKAGKKGATGFKNMSRSAGVFNKQINLTHGLAIKLGTAFGLWKLSQVSEGFHEVVVEAERTTAMLEGLYGTAEKGRAAFGWIMDLDAPFGLSAIQDSFVKFRSVGIDPTTGSLEALLAGVAAFGGTDETLKRASVAIQQMAGKGVVSMEELRQQLGEAVPTAMAIMADQLGMSVGEMVDVISKGQMDSKRGLDAFFTGMAAKYGDATDRMMQTWGGMTRKMAKEWTVFRVQVMQSGPFQVMKERLGDLLDEIDRLKKNGQLDIWASDMADGVLASVGLIMAGFETLTKAVYGFRAVFGILAEKYYANQINKIDHAIEHLSKKIEPGFWSRFYATDTNPEERARITKELERLKAEREEMLMRQQGGQDMAGGNIQKMDQYAKKIRAARAELAQLRADMQARRGERPDADEDLGVPKKITPTQDTDTGAADAAKKEYDKLIAEVAKAQEEFQKALVIPSGTFEIMEQQLRVDVGQYITGFDQTAADAGKTREAFEAMYSDLKFQSEDYYEYRKSQLEKQAEDYEQLTGDEVLAHQWLIERLKALDQERAAAVRGNHQYLMDLSERTGDAIENSFSTFFNDVFRGDLDSAADYFRAFCSSLSDSFSNMMGQMMKEMMFGGGSSGGSGLFGDLFSGIRSVFGGGLDDNVGLGADWGSTLWHSGGQVGRDTAPTRNVPASVFSHAPRLHRGYPALAPDEFPAILQRGEIVIPAPKAGTASPSVAAVSEGRGSNDVGREKTGDVYEVNIYANDSKSFMETMNRDPGSVLTILNRALEKNPTGRNKLKRMIN